MNEQAIAAFAKIIEDNRSMKESMLLFRTVQTVATQLDPNFNSAAFARQCGYDVVNEVEIKY